MAETPAQPPPQLPPPPGWYPDPQGEGLRWWDGFRWTEHVQAAMPQSPAPHAYGPPVATPAAPGQPVRVPRVPQQKWWHIPLLVAIAVFSTLLYIAAQFIG